MEKYELIGDLEERNANLLQKQTNQVLEIAELRAENIELKEKETQLKEQVEELTEKVFDQNTEIQNARLMVKEAEVAQERSGDVLTDRDSKSK